MILTVHGTPEEEVKGLDIGADDYMIKPFDVTEFETRALVLLRCNAGLRSFALSFSKVLFDLT